MASRRDFPVLLNQRDRQKLRNGRGYHVCNVCHLTVEPRNSRRHASKCARLKREDPALWTLWKLDMSDCSEKDIRARLGTYRNDLVKRGQLPLGPLTRKGEWR